LTVRVALVAGLTLAGCGGGSGTDDPIIPQVPTPHATGPSETPDPIATPMSTPTPQSTAASVTLVAVGCGPTTTEIPAECPPGVVARSDDGGRTWTTSRIEGVRFSDIEFIDARRGWATANGDLLETTDGGVTWQSRLDRVPREIAEPVAQLPFFEAVSFADDDHGIVAGYTGPFGFILTAFILTTDDGGATWRVSYTQENSSINSACLTRGGFGVTDGRPTRVTNDWGATWRTVDDPLRGAAGARVGCSGERDLWMVTVYPFLAHSADGGLTWTDESASLPGEGNGLRARITFADETLGAITWSDRDIVLTRDGGRTWTRHAILDAPVPFDDAAIIDERNVVALTWGTAGVTEDGGESWNVFPMTPGEFTRFADVDVAR